MNNAFCRSGRIAAFLSAAAALLVGLGAVSTPSAHAQTAQFLGSQTNLFSAMDPAGVAVDSAGNIYIANRSYDQVLKETPNTSGGYTQSIVDSNVSHPGAVAVDNSGNVYIVDPGNFRVVKDTINKNGIYLETTIRQALSEPNGVAVDGSGNVYISDTFHTGVLKETLSNGHYVESKIGNIVGGLNNVGVDSKGNVYATDNTHAYKLTLSNGAYTQSTLGSGLVEAAGIAVDPAGIVYICDYVKDRMYKETPSGNSYVQSALPLATSLMGGPHSEGALGVAVDGYGRVYIADSGPGTVIRINQAGADFGQVQIGKTSPKQTLMFNFSAAGTLNNLLTLTQNVSAMDFANAGTGTCTQGSFYFSPFRCTVDVTFSPRYAGDRNGAVLFRNAGLQTFVTSYLHGFGFAAQLTYFPAYQRTVPYLTSGQAPPQAVAVDGNGVVYIADTNNNIVRREAPFHGTYNSFNVGIGLSSPWALALDAAGNLFVADPGNGRVVKLVPAGNGSWQESVVANNLSSPYGVAAGPDGSVYISDTFNSRVLREIPSGTGYATSTIPISGLNHPYGIGVDGTGNLYVSDVSNQKVLKLAFSMFTGKYTQTTLASGVSAGFGLAVDAVDNVYVALRDNATVIRYTPSGNIYVPHAVAINSLSKPFGVAVDVRGNVYVADVGNDQIMEADFADPPNVNFADTQKNETSTDSPKVVTLVNAGNLPLTLPPPSSGQNPSVPANFSVESGIAGLCPALVPGSFTTSLAVGASCELYISFTPGSVGSFNSSLVITDNALSSSTSQQSIALSGNGTKIPTTVDWTTPAAITYGTALSATQLNAMASDPGSNPIAGTFIYAPAAGAVPPSGSQLLSVSFTPTDAADYTNASGNVMLTVNKAVLTVSAKAASKTYGAANPALTYTITGFVNGDTLATAVTGTPALTTTATAASPVGSYPIQTAIGTLASANYSFKFVNAALTVNKAALTVSATAASKSYGAANPALTYTITGFVNGDTAATAVTGTPALTTTATAASPVGSYPIQAAIGTLASTNYSFKFVNATLTVNKTVLTVSAKATSKTYGAANPAFTYTIAGFVNGDTLATAVTGTPALTTAATASSPVGSYPIQAAIGTLTSTNYSFTFVNAALTVNKASLTITATNASVLYNAAIPALTWTPAGFVNGDTSAVLSGVPVEATTAVKGSLPGAYPITITAGTLAATNYSLTFVNGTLTITSSGTEPTPTFTPAPGTFTGSADVTLKDTGAGVVIHYTTDGTTPLITSPTYSVPIHLTTTKTVKAIAFGPVGWLNSAVASGVYTIQ